MRKFLLVLLACLPLTLSAQTTDSLRVLLIGNSFTHWNKMPDMLREIVKTKKKPLEVVAMTKGGERFSGHLKNPKIVDALSNQHWDYVVLQEQSSAPAMPTAQVIKDVYPAAKSLDSLAHVGSPNVQVIFYMTWGHKYGSFYKMDNYPISMTYEGMFERLKTSYLEMTYDNGAICAPVGMAWDRVRKEKPDWQLYKQDCFHPSELGSYLIAHVLYTTIFQQRYQSSYNAGLPSEQAEYIQRIAQETVLNNKKLLNIVK